MSENDGWIKLHRKFLRNPISKKPTVSHYFIYCLLKANHEPEKVILNEKEIIIERGELLTGRKSAAKDTGLSQQNIRSAQKLLYRLGMLQKVTTKSTTMATVISVCNYNDYQRNNFTTNHPSNQEVTTGQPPGNHRVTTYKNIKNEKNKDNPPIIPPRGSGSKKPKEWKFPEDKRPGLNRFYSEYLRKKGYAQLEKTWDKLVPSELTEDDVMELYEEDRLEFEQRERKLVPYPSTWLNDRHKDNLAKKQLAIKPKEEKKPTQDEKPQSFYNIMVPFVKWQTAYKDGNTKKPPPKINWLKVPSWEKLDQKMTFKEFIKIYRMKGDPDV